MEALKWDGDPPALRSPVLVAAFAGWNDAASAATTALEAVAGSLDAERVAEIDPEEFYDFQVTRPTIRLTEGQAREVDWPDNALFAARAPERRARPGAARAGSSRTCAGARSPSGDARGRRAARGRDGGHARRAARRRRPHAAPVPITGLASDPDLVERLASAARTTRARPGSSASSTTPAGARELTSASLWAAVPHYVAAVPNPKAALALLRRLEGFTGVAIEASELEDAMDRFETQVDRAVAVEPRDRGARPPARVRAGARTLGSPARTCPRATRSPSDFQRFLRQRRQSRGSYDPDGRAAAIRPRSAGQISR